MMEAESSCQSRWVGEQPWTPRLGQVLRGQDRKTRPRAHQGGWQCQSWEIPRALQLSYPPCTHWATCSPGALPESICWSLGPSTLSPPAFLFSWGTPLPLSSTSVCGACCGARHCARHSGVVLSLCPGLFPLHSLTLCCAPPLTPAST